MTKAARRLAVTKDSNEDGYPTSCSRDAHISRLPLALSKALRLWLPIQEQDCNNVKSF